MRPQSCLSWQKFIAASVLILFQITGVACQRDNVSRVRIELHDLPNDKPAVATKQEQLPPLPDCLSAGPASLHPGAPGTGHHKVTLTWNASIPSKDQKSTALGYCIYRSQNEQELKKNPRCKHCERINQIPVRSTGCVDDVVADTKKYFYVVTAINSGHVLSVPSNDVMVRIPPAQQQGKPDDSGKWPRCRAGQ